MNIKEQIPDLMAEILRKHNKIAGIPINTLEFNLSGVSFTFPLNVIQN